MEDSWSLLRLVRHLLAFLFAALATTYSILWIFHVRHPQPQPGFFTYEYSALGRCMWVGILSPGSPAAQAGLHSGDQVVAIDGQKLENLAPLYQSIIAGQKDVVEFTVEDPRSPTSLKQLKLVLRGGQPEPQSTKRFDFWRATNWLEGLLGFPMGYYPLFFLVVGVGVLLLRPDDRNAWLLALLFGGFLAGGPLFEGAVPPSLRGFEVAYKFLLSWPLSMAIFYYFFAVFPAPSPVDRKLPWLKYLLAAVAITATAPIGLRCLIEGGALPLYLDPQWPGARMLTWALTAQTGFPVPASRGWPTYEFTFFGSFFGLTILGPASLVSNSFLSTDAQVLRKAQVMLWGTAISVTRVVLAVGTAIIRGPLAVPLLGWQACVLILSSLLPLSFAYAVVKHRILEIPVLLKRSARYLLVQRGFTILLLTLWLAAIRLFTSALSGLVGTFSNVVLVLGLIFGVALVWIAAPRVKRVTERIDRAFFRSAYDARQILESLVEETRTVTSREELGALLAREIKQALHPVSVTVYLADRDGQLRVFPENPEVRPTEHEPIRSQLPLLQRLARNREPWQVSDADLSAHGLLDGLSIFAPLVRTVSCRS